MGATEELLRQAPYATHPGEHRELFRSAVREAIQHHGAMCPPFAKWYKKQGADPDAHIEDLTKVPYLPVSIFKRLALKSVEESDVVRVLKSSATSSQIPSRVVLDRITRDRQMRCLAVMMGAMMGSKRRPFVVLDGGATQGSDMELSARVAGLRGYLMMASETHYALDANLELNADKLQELFNQFHVRRLPVCIIGYTYMLYQYSVVPLLRAGRRLKLPPDSMVLHFGGWKRLERQAVDRARLNAEVQEVFAMDEPCIRDVYGFTEQLGLIYPDDGRGVRLAPVYSDVIVRDPVTLEPVPDGTPGFLEFITPLPHSYPGVALLLDDLGCIISRDQGDDGRYGTRFEVLGRAKGTEIRGCGDTLPEQVYAVRA
jgi:phenylacetate-coenzyme A ligase PaaK-like adenylate-forming protein